MFLQCPNKEQGKTCHNPECPACLDELIGLELGEDLDLTMAKRNE